MRPLTLSVLLAISLFCTMSASAAPAPDDRIALQGLKSAKVIFDVRVPDQEKLVFNLQLIKETLQGIRRQKVRPVAIVTFRGPGVKLVTRESADSEVVELLAEMKGDGVRFEVCNVAMRLFKVEQAAVIPEVVRVGNVLNSLIGYQSRGYALVSLN